MGSRFRLSIPSTRDQEGQFALLTDNAIAMGPPARTAMADFLNRRSRATISVARRNGHRYGAYARTAMLDVIGRVQMSVESETASLWGLRPHSDAGRHRESADER